MATTEPKDQTISVTEPILSGGGSGIPGGEVEIDPEQVLKGDPEPEPTAEAPAEEADPEEVIEILVPSKEDRTWEIGKGDNKISLKQSPLSYFQKMEFFSLLAGTIDDALSGENGMSVAALMTQVGARNRSGQFSVEDLRDADAFVLALVKVAGDVPEFLAESYCIWLGVSRGDRPYVKTLMNLPVSEGGLSDDQGLDIIQTFLDQNIEAMYSFFVEKIPALVKRSQMILVGARKSH